MNADGLASQGQCQHRSERHFRISLQVLSTIHFHHSLIVFYLRTFIMDDAPLMRIPPEVRMLIYPYLLNATHRSQSTIAIRNQLRPPTTSLKKKRRTSYYVLERTLTLPCYKTTYGLITPPAGMHTAIMCVNRQIREEASHFLYGRHEFHFGADLEAVTPFLEDKTGSTRGLIRDVSLRRRIGVGVLEGDGCVWTSMCRSLRTLPSLRKVTLIIEGGQPDRPWDGPSELSVSDLRLLYATRHESLQWVRELVKVDMAELEIMADIESIPEPKTSEMLVFAALSGSIEGSLVEWLREMGVNAKVGPRFGVVKKQQW